MPRTAESERCKFNKFSQISQDIIFYYAPMYITKVPDRIATIGDSKNGGYLLSHLVGQYHRRQ